MTREPFIDARAAARFVGYTPDETKPAGSDPELRAFYAWATAARVPKHYRGRRCLLFRVSELEAAVLASEREAEPEAALSRMETLAREHVRLVASRTK